MSIQIQLRTFAALTCASRVAKIRTETGYQGLLNMIIKGLGLLGIWLLLTLLPAITRADAVCNEQDSAVTATSTSTPLTLH